MEAFDFTRRQRQLEQTGSKALLYSIRFSVFCGMAPPSVVLLTEFPLRWPSEGARVDSNEDMVAVEGNVAVVFQTSSRKNLGKKE